MFYGILIYSVMFLWKKWRKTPMLKFKNFLTYFLSRIGLSVCIIFLILGSAIGYYNYISPAKMPRYTLTNGEKIIEFQAMSHIASESFYQSVKNNIIDAKKQGFILYFEWVWPGTEESHDAFNAQMGIEFTPELYSQMSTLYGVTSQDNNLFLGHGETQDVNADITMDEVMRLYEEKFWTWNTDTSDSETSSEILDVGQDLTRVLSGLNSRELSLLRSINQMILNIIMKHENLRENILTLSGTNDIFSVILDDRNEYLAQEVLSSADAKIYIIYGLMHFDGFFEILKKQDPNWKIVETIWTQVIVPGEEDSDRK